MRFEEQRSSRLQPQCGLSGDSPIEDQRIGACVECQLGFEKTYFSWQVDEFAGRNIRRIGNDEIEGKLDRIRCFVVEDVALEKGNGAALRITRPSSWANEITTGLASRAR